MIDKKTVTILPETRDAILCVTFRDTVTAPDYMEFFEKPLERIYNTYGYVSVLISFEKNFSGWTKEAADLSFRCISTYAPKTRKIAYINAPDSRMLLMKMLAPISTAETRFYEPAQLQSAFEWIGEEE